MNRPRLPFVLEYFTSLQNRVEEDLTIIKEYNQIKEEQGEFLAGRFIIEVYLETQQTIEELRNAKEKAGI